MYLKYFLARWCIMFLTFWIEVHCNTPQYLIPILNASFKSYVWQQNIHQEISLNLSNTNWSDYRNHFKNEKHEGWFYFTTAWSHQVCIVSYWALIYINDFLRPPKWHGRREEYLVFISVMFPIVHNALRDTASIWLRIKTKSCLGEI